MKTIIFHREIAKIIGGYCITEELQRRKDEYDSYTCQQQRKGIIEISFKDQLREGQRFSSSTFCSPHQLKSAQILFFSARHR
jgi:hypothetical protein